MTSRATPPLILLIAAGAVLFAAPAHAEFAGCAVTPTSSVVVNVNDKGAKGDGRTNDTPAIQKAIDEVAGTGGTVYVPDGTYMVRATGKRRLRLRSNMTLKLSNGAVLSAIPSGSASYSVLKIAKAEDVTVVGGTLQGDRARHENQTGEWGMGIYIGPDAKRVTIAGVTAKDMWGDGFYVGGASDVAFCSVTATHNRRQGLSIVEANKILVTDSVFQETRGTRPSAGIDIEPDRPEQRVVNVRIQNSRFINNAGGGIMIAGKRGYVANVEIILNVFKEARPILVENAPAVRSTSICDNRHIGQQAPPASEGLNPYADAVEVVSLQDDCRSGRDLRFEVKRQSKKKKPQAAN
ncbi:MAG: glycosyl hydrolase family 28-related protein [Methyloceanibacter sp.]|uniref:glycosyl hydrolase family 28-related protein n=1 Tax=Methyloceanibacter sp. TaxID=1965321 RepID=UPI003D6CA417